VAIACPYPQTRTSGSIAPDYKSATFWSSSSHLILVLDSTGRSYALESCRWLSATFLGFETVGNTQAAGNGVVG
jgi:hypothetical protein